ncbi:formylglycine-generating enzyme required for sulfatase activity [Lachnotalea glycerini]|uniref:Formylglycine-generating enzyme required for sulfatase activity n=1 Tax=Lachnotalea glycerini TaxID=1763509 RepID=A0A318ERV7_9FIRM|nr:SUMF1/EgtB/PvdO family nonheme iron enzyme [Lachnotalea glycerini]PXV95689.1 formylglycine-generating enzyme required for sulfatase activity [Lachnotalea glycerini]
MKKALIFLALVFILLCSACTSKKSNSLVLVEGGSFVNSKSNYYDTNETISDFYMSKYEITQKEWVEVMGSNPSEFQDDNLPVEMVSWYDCIEYCNKRSIKENLQPYYNIDKDHKDSNNQSEYDYIKWTITINEGANGYRLPTEAQWEYAAGGGQKSLNYQYSGSNKTEEVAWFWRNSGNKYLSGDWIWPTIENNNCKTKLIGDKKSNELGLYDMSGNVREWCYDWYEDSEYKSGLYRVWKGGGWIGGETCCEASYRGKFEASGMGSDQGFRVCRDTIN